MKKLIFSLICLLLSSLLTFAQLSEAGKWTAQVYTEYGFIEPNIVYEKVDGLEMKLDVYRPKVKNPKPLPTLVFIHGGGWRAGTKESYSLRVLPWLEKGWNVVNVEYRVTSQGRAPAGSVLILWCCQKGISSNIFSPVLI